MAYAKPEVRAANWTDKEYMERIQEIRSEVLPDLYNNRDDTDAWSARNSTVVNEVEELDFEMRSWRMANAPMTPPTPPQGVHMAHRDAPMSLGSRAVTDEGMRSWIGSHTGTSPKVELSYRAPGDPLNLGSVEGLLPIAQPYLVEPFRTQLRIRDLLTVIPTQYEVIPYRTLTAANTSNATPVAEGATKPLSTLVSAPHSATLEVIAVGDRVSNRIISDATVAAIINSQVQFEVRLTEEDQLLHGNGTSPNLKGFYDYTGEGLQTQAYTSTDVGKTLGLALAKVGAVGGTPDGVIMNYTDAWTMWTKRAAGGSGTYDAGSPFNTAPTTVWGYPVVLSTAMASNKALVGSFRRAARLWDRQSLFVQLFNQHSDWALSNEVLILCEERIALTVERPDFVVDVSLS